MDYVSINFNALDEHLNKADELGKADAELERAKKNEKAFADASIAVAEHYGKDLVVANVDYEFCGPGLESTEEAHYFTCVMSEIDDHFNTWRDIYLNVNFTNGRMLAIEAEIEQEYDCIAHNKVVFENVVTVTFEETLSEPAEEEGEIIADTGVAAVTPMSKLETKKLCIAMLREICDDCYEVDLIEKKLLHEKKSDRPRN